MLLRSTLVINGISTALCGLALLLAPAPLARLPLLKPSSMSRRKAFSFSLSDCVMEDCASAAVELSVRPDNPNAATVAARSKNARRVQRALDWSRVGSPFTAP